MKLAQDSTVRTPIVKSPGRDPEIETTGITQDTEATENATAEDAKGRSL